MKTPMHVHNGLLTKIRYGKLPVLNLSVLVMELPEVAFGTGWIVGGNGQWRP